jgi:DNA-nicking Smr family endonuclease
MSGGRRHRPLSDDERVLWTTFTEKIKPLQAKPNFAAPEPDETPAPPAPLRKKSAAPAKSPPPPKPAPPKPQPAPLAPIGRKEKQRIARGHHDIAGRFDMHGLTQAEAHPRLLGFLRDASARGAKLVLVITGKSGVLRQQTPMWLALPEFRMHVVGFETAAIGHGGDGALYVRVRKPKG